MTLAVKFLSLSTEKRGLAFEQAAAGLAVSARPTHLAQSLQVS